MINKKFGKLTPINEHSTTRNGHIRYTCKCDCGSTTNVLGTHLRQGNTKSCGCDTYTVGPYHKDWNGIGQISGAFWYDHIVKSATGGKRRTIELKIDKEYAWLLFISQEMKCALTGIVLKFPVKHKDKAWTASLDRIDSSKGYVEGNVQWVHKDINMMKRIYNNQYFIEMCKLVASNSLQK